MYWEVKTPKSRILFFEFTSIDIIKELLGIEPETSGMVSQDHTPRPPLVVKKEVAESHQMQLLPIVVQG